MEMYLTPNSRVRNYEIITSNDESFQTNCLSCSQCHKCMAGKEIVQQDDKAYCWQCFERLFGLRCASCLKLITGLSQMSFIYYNNQTWHRECFRCSSCRTSLVGQEFEQERSFAYCKRCSGNRKFYIG